MGRWALILTFICSLSNSITFACGDYCGWDGLYGTTGYSGYDWGSSLYDLSIYLDSGYSSSNSNWGGSCGTLYSSCGSSSSTLVDITLYTSNDSFCGNSCSSLYSGFGNGWGSNPLSSIGGSPWMNPSSILNPFSNPYSSTNYPSYPSITRPPSNVFPPFSPPLSQPPFSVGNNFPFPGTSPVMSPWVGYNPLGTTAPTYNNFPPPPSRQLPWGGCDNITVMCPTGPVTRPPYTTPTAPVFPPGGNNGSTSPLPTGPGTPTYQTIPTDPIRYQVPRGAHR